MEALLAVCLDSLGLLKLEPHGILLLHHQSHTLLDLRLPLSERIKQDLELGLSADQLRRFLAEVFLRRLCLSQALLDTSVTPLEAQLVPLELLLP